MVHPADNGLPADGPPLRPATPPATSTAKTDPVIGTTPIPTATPTPIPTAVPAAVPATSADPEADPEADRAGADHDVATRLTAEFEGTHGPEIVSRCVTAARHGAEDVMGSGTPDLIERIARKHLQVLAIVAAERRAEVTLRHAP